MSDFDRLFGTFGRFRDVIDVAAPLFAGPRITGIEVTQAIQYHRSAQHLTDGNDRGSDNAVQLVAYKPAIVRVYVAPQPGTDVGDPVGGDLEVERRAGFMEPWEHVTTLGTWLTGTVTPQDDAYSAERGSIWRSLNFRIPASDFFGSLRLTVRLTTGQARSVSVEARLVQTLRVRVFAVRYRGPDTWAPPAGTTANDIALPAPTLADAQTTAAAAFRMMPVQETGSFAIASHVNWFYPLDDPRTGDGQCSVNWDSFIKLLKLLRDNDGNRADVVYYGLLPTGTPVEVPGCGDDGIGAAVTGDTQTFVHEIGHAYDFDHTPSGAVGFTDPDYPTYEPYPSASIGEYGLDIDSGAVFSPAMSTDYMSYGPARWMSLYQHRRLVNHARLAPWWLPARNPFEDVPREYNPEYEWWPEPPWERDLRERFRMQRVISVRGTIDDRGAVNVESVARVSMNPRTVGIATSWTMQPIGESGDVVARGIVMRSQPRGHDCGCAPGSREGNPDRLPLTFHAVLADTERGTALRLVDREGSEVWEQRAPDAELRFADVGADADGDVAHLRWAFADGGTPSDVWAQWSGDDETWHGLAVGLRDGRGEAGIAGLPSGRASIRLLAHDGFSTVVSEPVRIEVPDMGPQVAILFPADGQRVPAEAEFATRGSAVDQGGMPLSSEQLEWLLDEDPVGTGRTAVLRVTPGEHRLLLRARGENEGSATVAIHA